MTDVLFIALDVCTISVGVIGIWQCLAGLRGDIKAKAGRGRWALAALATWFLLAFGWAALLAGEDMLSRIVIASFAARFGVV